MNQPLTHRICKSNSRHAQQLVRALRLLLVIATTLLAACREAATTPTTTTESLPPTRPASIVREITSPAGPGSGEPELFAAADGQVVLSWLEKIGEKHYALRFATRGTTGEHGGWSEPRTVASGSDWFVNWADFPSVIKLPDGSLAAHWLVKSASRKYAYDIRIARSIDGGLTWTQPIVPHRDGTPTEHGFVSLLPQADGRIAAVWLDGRNFRSEEHAQRDEASIINAAHAINAANENGGESHEATNEMTLRYASIGTDGTLTDEAELDDRVCECCQTAAALTADGLVVVYRDRSDGEVRDFSVVRRVDGKWTPPQTLYQDGWETSACPVNGAAIAARERQVAVAWFTRGSGDTPQVKISFSDNAGATFSQPITADDGAAQGRVDVILLDDGSALVSWLTGTMQSGNIKVRRVRPDGTQDAAATIAATSIGRASGFPRMVRTGDIVVCAWTEAGAPSQVRTALINVEIYK